MNKKIKHVLNRMKGDDSVRDYFFKNIANYKDLEIWFNPLNKNDFFNCLLISKEEYWNQLLYLKALANKEELEEKTKETLLEIMKKILKGETRNSEVDLDVIKIVFKLETQNIKSEYFELILKVLNKMTKESWYYNKLLEEIVNQFGKINQKEQKKVLEKILEFKFEGNKYIFTSQKRAIENIRDKNTFKIAKNLKVEGLKLLVNKLIEYLNNKKEEVSLLRRPSIKPHSQNWQRGSEVNVLIDFIRIYLENLDIEEQKEAINFLIKQERDILKRIGLYGINLNYEKFKLIFWNFLENIKNPNIYKVKLELYQILELNNDIFSKKELKKIMNWVSETEYDDLNNSEYKDKVTAYRKKEWLLPLKEKNPEIRAYYDELNKINDIEVEHPGFSSWTEAGWVTKSLLGDKEEYLNLEITKFLDLIEEVKEQNKNKRMKYIDLEEDFLSYVKHNPREVVKNIESLKNLEISYKIRLLNGLKQAWNQNKEIEWDKVLDFMINELKELKEKKLDITNEDIYQYKKEMASIILEGLKNDENAFDINFLPKAKKILFELIKDKDIIDKGNILWENEKIDYRMLLLNSYHGQVLITLINYSLREVRIKKCEWDEEIKTFIDNEIMKENEYKKFILIAIAYHLNNFLYLDKEWIMDKFEYIFIKGNEFNEIPTYSYFKNLGRSNLNIYEKFKEHKHYEKLLDKDYSMRVIEEIVNIYIYGYDKESIFRLLEGISEEEIKRIGYYLSDIKIDITEEMEKRLEKLLKKIVEKLIEKEKLEELDSFCTWLKFFKRKSLENLKGEFIEIYKNQKNDYWNSEGIEELMKLGKDSLVLASELFITMLRKDCYPTYKEQKIKSFVKEIYENEETTENGKLIIKLYFDKKYYFLNDLLQ